MTLKEINKTIDNIVWYIPIKKLRNYIRDYLKFIVSTLNYHIPVYDDFFYIDFRKSLSSDYNFLNKYLKLIKNLDDESIETVSKIIFDRIMNYENLNDRIYIYGEEAKIISEISNHMKNRVKKINDECFIYNKYLLSYNVFEAFVFYEKYNMKYIKNMENVKSKNIIDAGACFGDSAIIFSDYTDKNVYAFEPMKKNYTYLLKTIELNNSKNIIPVNLALGDKTESISIYNKLDYGLGCNLHTKENINDNLVEEKIKVITLDDYVKENKIEVGLIKTDLEGYEPTFLKGAINTIRDQKPVLFISIYHNYNDFFEIKPLIESWNLGYKFRITQSKEPFALAGTLLIAEVY